MSIFEVTIRNRILPSTRLTKLLSDPPQPHEIDLLKHIDIEKFYRLFLNFFMKNERLSCDYVKPIMLMVATRENFELKDIKMSLNSKPHYVSVAAPGQARIEM
jgi:hypothetical protein